MTIKIFSEGVEHDLIQIFKSSEQEREFFKTLKGKKINDVDTRTSGEGVFLEIAGGAASDDIFIFIPYSHN